MSSEATAVVTAVSASAFVGITGFLLAKYCYKNWSRIRFSALRMIRGNDASIDDWDRASYVYRIPSSTLGFLVAEYLVLWLSIEIPALGGGFFSIEAFASVWAAFIFGLDSALGMIGVVGVVICTVFGFCQDFPPTRLKTLGVIAVFGVLIGISH